ncbi:MAG: helix-turn-helix domain-containing protein [Saprospiraceae bacterium]
MQSITITQVNIHELESIIEGAVRNALKTKEGTQATISDGDLLTVPQAAELLHLSVPTIYGLIHRREISSLKRARRVYFKKEDLIQYLEDGRRNAQDTLGHGRISSTKAYKKSERS